MKLKKKIGLFCNIATQHVFESPDVESIYEIPLILHRDGFDKEVIKRLKIKNVKKHTGINYLDDFIDRFKNPHGKVDVAICGKYNGLHDAYKSILEAFIHSGVANNTKVNIRWVDTEELEINDNPEVVFRNVDGILIPGGFGDRGIEGKIMSSRYARENNIPFFGICLGMQCAVIDYARHLCGMKAANSTEFNKRTKYPVIDLMKSQKKIIKKGASMRLGSYNCSLNPGTKAYAAYRRKAIQERHRHRYEFNNSYKTKLKNAGLKISGMNEKLNLVEMIEISAHPWFVGVQFHPELRSTLANVHPLFKDFISAAIKYRDAK